MKLKVCIIGCGDMGRQHAAGWKLREDAEIVAVCDLLDDRRDRMAEDTGAAGYTHYRDAIMHEGVNAVSVCIPVCSHSMVSVFAAEHGRHVLCEKPLALTLDQADAMIDAARSNGVLLSTSFQCRGFARHLKTREMLQPPLAPPCQGREVLAAPMAPPLDKGGPGGVSAFGGPVFARFTDIRDVRPKLAMHRKSENGGPVIDMAGHYFDLMRFLTGSEPVSIFARGHIFGKGKPRLAAVEDFAIDAADITVEMTDGHVLDVFVNWGMPEGFGGITEELIVGPALSVQTVGGKVTMKSGAETETWDANEGNPPGSSVRINDMVEAIREGRRPEVTGEDGRIALSVSLAALKSIETREIIKL